MKWMFYIVKAWKIESVPFKVLVEAANADIATAASQQNWFYNSEALREVCGCLLTISMSTGKYLGSYLAVSFAHYTVMEYLASSHRYRPDSFFSLGARTLVSRQATSILRGALLIQPEDIQECYDMLYNTYGEAKMSMFPSFGTQCASKVFRLMRDFDEYLSKDAEAVHLISEIFNQAKEHHDLITQTWTLAAQVKFEFHPDEVSAMISGERSVEAYIFSQLALLPCPNLAREWLKKADPRIVFNARLELKCYFAPWKWYAAAQRWRIRGSITECFALLSTRRTEVSFAMLAFLIKAGAGAFDPQRTLISFIGVHGRGHARNCLESYLLEELLSSGAQADMSKAHVTPLQIAVATLDVAGTRSLLRAKADPNRKGCSAIAPWPEDDCRSDFNCLSGLTPLQICKKTSSKWGYLHNDETSEGELGEERRIEEEHRTEEEHEPKDEDLRSLPRIVEILLEYGARG